MHIIMIIRMRRMTMRIIIMCMMSIAAIFMRLRPQRWGRAFPGVRRL